jgi:hypothetical protein
MRIKVKFPALMAARPPKHKNPKISVCAFDTIVDIGEVSPSEFPVAIIAHHPASKTEYRTIGGKLYRSRDTDIDRFVERCHRLAVDSRRDNHITGHILREMHRQIEKINDYTEDRFWPKAAKHLLRSGMDTAYAQVQEIVSQSPLIDLRGPWTGRVGEIAHMRFLAGDPDQRLSMYERMTHDAFRAVKVMDGQVWLETPEPCYVLQKTDQGIGHISIGNVGEYVRNADTPEGLTWWHGLDNQAVSVLNYENVSANFAPFIHRFTPMDVLIPEVLQADFPSLEIDRCARALGDIVSEAMRGRKSVTTAFLKLPSTRTVTAWTDLLDLVESYDPLEGVPEYIEDGIVELIESVGSNPDDADLIKPRIRAQVLGQLEGWRSRTVEFNFGDTTKAHP